jgi:hypothetical protein
MKSIFPLIRELHLFLIIETKCAHGTYIAHSPESDLSERRQSRHSYLGSKTFPSAGDMPPVWLSDVIIMGNPQMHTQVTGDSPQQTYLDGYSSSEFSHPVISATTNT